MTSSVAAVCEKRLIDRRRIAADRAILAHAHLASCTLCAHRCAVNRLSGEQGVCHAGSSARVFSAQIEVSDELELIPTFAIALSGCDLRCSFCITGKESWNPRAGELFDINELAGEAVSALNNGCRSVMILGGEPTIHLPTALQIVAALPDDARLIWKTNAHASSEARHLLDGLFDVWLADYKFGNDACAQRLALVPNYTATIRANLSWAHTQSELIVRHLLMPGHVDCCWKPVARWLAEILPQTKVNLRSGFWPAWQSRRHAELAGTTSNAEAERALSIARDYHLCLIE